MNKKVLIGIGVIILALIIILPILSKKGFLGNIAQDLQNSTKKEITVGTDVCAEFPNEWVASAISKTIVRTKPFSMKGTYSCSYFINETNFAGINVDDLSVETQKKGQIQQGNTINTDPRIKMEHFIVARPDGSINSIALILNPNKFVTVDRFYGKVFDNEGVIAFAIKVAERIQSGQNQVVVPTLNENNATPTPQSQAPLPQGAGIVRNFFNLINEGKISDVVNMLSSNAAPDDSSKQMWGVQFNAFKKIEVKKIESAGENTYKVTLNVDMKPGTENVQPMPYYGWGNGEFVRWVSLEKVNNSWKITGIATSP